MSSAFLSVKASSILFTNRWDLTTWQIITIYAYRWQIELLFLFVKRTLGGLHLLTHCQRRLQIQFYLMLATALLLLYFKQRNEKAAETEDPEGEAMPRPAETTEDDSGEVVSIPAKETEDDSNAEDASAANTAASGAEQAQKPTSQSAEAIPVSQAKEETPPAPPANQETAAPQPAKQEPQPTPSQERQAVPASQTRPERTCQQGRVHDKANAEWHRRLGEPLKRLWRISRHWLEVFRQNLARAWDPGLFRLTPGSS